jgi:hypothetical protein
MPEKSTCWVFFDEKRLGAKFLPLRLLTVIERLSPRSIARTQQNVNHMIEETWRRPAAAMEDGDLKDTYSTHSTSDDSGSTLDKCYGLR